MTYSTLPVVDATEVLDSQMEGDNRFRPTLLRPTWRRMPSRRQIPSRLKVVLTVTALTCVIVASSLSRRWVRDMSAAWGTTYRYSNAEHEKHERPSNSVTRQNSDTNALSPLKIIRHSSEGALVGRKTQQNDENSTVAASENTTIAGPQVPEGILMISTPLESDSDAFGSLFIVEPIDDLFDVIIHTFSINMLLAQSEAAEVEVWSKPLTYEGFETDRSQWTLVCNTTVTSQGQDTLSEINDISFTDVVIQTSSSQAFYVSLKSNSLRYTKAQEADLNTPQSADDYVSILVGKAVEGDLFEAAAVQPGRFNGAIHYSLSPVPVTQAPETPEPVGTDVSAPTPSPTPDTLTYGLPKMIKSTFVGGNGGYGCFFSIKALDTIRITTLDFNTDKNSSVMVEVYAIDGEYRGYERQPEKWKLISNVAVQGRGEGNPTRIPEASFETLKIEENQTKSFYLTLSSEDLRYSNAIDPVGTIFVRTFEMELYVGKGVSGYPAFDENNGLFNSRVFNGAIHYEVADDPDGVDSSDLLREQYKYESDIISTFDGGTGGYGAMFSLAAMKNIMVYGIDCHLDTTDDVRLEVWTISGEFRGKETQRPLWTRVAETYAKGQGVGSPTPITFDSSPVVIDEGQTQSFYVTSLDTNMRYTKVDIPSGAEFASNSDVKFLSGVGVTYPFGNTYDGRLFNGVVHYKIMDTPTPTAAPTLSPTPAPTPAKKGKPQKIVTQQLIRIKGVAARRMMRLLQESGAGNLPESSVSHFEEATGGFVGAVGSDLGIAVDSVIVSTDITSDQVTGDVPEDDGEPALDMYTTISGEYSPPPDIEFGALVSDSFNEEGDVFVDDLKEDPSFEEATGVSATEVSFPLPGEVADEIEKQEDAPEPTKNYLKIIYVVCGAVGAFLFFLILFIVARNKKRKREELRGGGPILANLEIGQFDDDLHLDDETDKFSAYAKYNDAKYDDSKYKDSKYDDTKYDDAKFDAKYEDDRSLTSRGSLPAQ